MLSPPGEEAKATARSRTASVPVCSVEGVKVSFRAGVVGATAAIADRTGVFGFGAPSLAAALVSPWAFLFTTFFFAIAAAVLDFLTEPSLVVLASRIWRT
jgi:hypothetical protein